MKNLKNKKGITLVALIITIVIMLILAGVTLGAINGGLFNYAQKAKVNTENYSIKEQVKESFIFAENNSKTGKVTTEDMQKALDKVLGKDCAEAIDNEGGITIGIGDTYYPMDMSGNIGEGKKIEKYLDVGDIKKTGQGTKNDPYQIRCIEDLVGFSRMIASVSDSTSNAYSGKYIVLTRDLDFNSIYSYNNYSSKYKYNSEIGAYEEDANSETTIMELCTTGRGFIPIGKSYGTKGQCYWGNFDGNGFTIKNIYIKKAENAGLFACFGEGKLENLTIDGNITSTGGTAGGIVVSGHAKMNKCCNKANVTAVNNASGILTAGSGTITECVNEGEIVSTGTAITSGITTSTSTVKKCYNKGKIIGNSGQAVGICGPGGKAINCYNIGEAIGIKVGAAGLGYGSITAKNCFNIGVLEGSAKSPGTGQRYGVARNGFFFKWKYGNQLCLCRFIKDK